MAPAEATFDAADKSIDVEAAKSEHTDSGEAASSKGEEADTYLHGLQLVLVFIALASSVFLIILDQTILIPAIPVIASHFNAVKQIGWISSSYFVTQCSTIFLWGQALAFFEQKVPLIMAIGIFELGSLIAAVSPNFVALIVGRAVAGLGGAAIMVATISISSTVIELKKRPVFFGMFGVMFVLGSSLGPIIGGTFTTHVTWRWCFYINLPVGGLSMIAISFLIPRTKVPVRPTKPPHFLLRLLRRALGSDRPSLAIDGFVSRLTSLDWLGGVITLGGIVSLTLALIAGGADGWSSTTSIVGLTVFGAAVILLVLWEALIMREDGMIPLRVARFLSVWGASGVAFMRMINSLVIMTYLPTLLQASRNYSALKSATATLPYAICMAVFALLGSVVVQKSGRYKWALVLGSAVSAIGAGVMYTLDQNSSYAKIAGFQVIASLGAGLVQMNAVLAAQADLDVQGLKADIPQATALVSFFQLIGGSLGGSLGGAILTTGVRSHTASLPAESAKAVLQSVEAVWTLSGMQRDIAISAYSLAMRNVFLTGAVASAAGFLLALLCRNHNIKGKNYKH